MKVYFHKIKKNDPNGVVLAEGVLHFCATRPTVVQPSEIMKVPVNVVVRVVGNVVLNISTHPKLVERAGTLFPALLTLDKMSPEEPLELAVKNEGRNPLHLMPDQLVGIGYLLPIEQIEPEEFSISVASRESPKSKPQKRNKDVKFEVK